jgi:hypothetical protein
MDVKPLAIIASGIGCAGPQIGEPLNGNAWTLSPDCRIRDSSRSPAASSKPA